MFETTAPILPMRDMNETSEFYQSLGFGETGRWEGQYGYMIMVREKVEIHFSLRDNLEPLKNSGSAYIRTTDVDSFSEMVTELGLPGDGCPSFCAAGDMPWGMRETSILDPNGNLLRIGQFIDG
ncbi:MAG: VOC family protein [Boseongicola sp.]|nr:VOC family protein [Boseongicola sp.]MDD9978736.1 VOC family protein [Boseongicola sp.]